MKFIRIGNLIAEGTGNTLHLFPYYENTIIKSENVEINLRFLKLPSPQILVNLKSWLERSPDKIVFIGVSEKGLPSLSIILNKSNVPLSSTLEAIKYAKMENSILGWSIFAKQKQPRKPAFLVHEE